MATPVERRFATAYREADRDEPGLIQEDDGTIWQVAPDGSRTELSGNGGSLPEQWTVGEFGQLTLTPSDWDTDVASADLIGLEDQRAPTLQVEGGVAQTKPYLLVKGADDRAHTRDSVAAFESSGNRLVEIGGTGTSLRVKPYPDDGEDALIVEDDGGNVVFAPAATAGDRSVIRHPELRATADDTEFMRSAGFEFVVFKSGAVGIAANAAPTDGQLNAGQVAIWFDATNGAAKVMAKGKTLNGTVVSGELGSLS